ncbi:carboxypeptidase B-like [Athalia rosae]|uniref:carboxypeptidase B-like n=1 Tax=Athalia rosae TaxID=37344 RepID=UPI0020338D35|nr:carboxypeptidase B-like [Athalia rosae]XP_048509952.1 carboxypeptidase B-like [Athalia rosae]XP_048509953.1 carboxypeptidase B-like [Athalia rosae]
MVSQHGEKVRRFFNVSVFCLLSVIFIPLYQATNYDGYKLYRVYPNTMEKIQLLRRLTQHAGYDFWQQRGSNAIKLMVPPAEQFRFEKLMYSVNISTALDIRNVAKMLQRDAMIRHSQLKAINGRRGANFPYNWGNFTFDRYLRYNEMWDFVNATIRKEPRAKFINVGTTFQGRKMIGVELSTSDKNPVIVIDGGIHAREWAAPMSVLYVLQNLIKDRKILEKLTFYIIPLVNPDGYEYSHVEDRLWRKTMSKSSISKCLGVDANRNFDSHWNEFGADRDPCSNQYSGPHAFSEPESRAIRDLIKTVKPVMYLTFHAYGPLVLHPWGFTTELPENSKELNSLGMKAAAEVARTFNTIYTVGSATNVLYAASGGSDDWSMEKAGVPLVYCIELEDFGSHFELPPTRLHEVVQQADTMVKIFTEYVKDKYADNV